MCTAHGGASERGPRELRSVTSETAVVTMELETVSYAKGTEPCPLLNPPRYRMTGV